jgi:hypothetical protein
VAECGDGKDNDGDLGIDMGFINLLGVRILADSQCSSLVDPSESS